MSSTEAHAQKKHQAAREAVDILLEIATLLNTQLDRTTLPLCVHLIENGVNPEVLASIIKELRRESEAIRGTGPPKMQ